MSSDIEVMLSAAAPQPSRPLDVGAVQRRGKRLRLWRRVTAVAVALPLLAGVAWAGARVNPFGSDPRPPAAGVRGCPGTATVSVFLKDDATAPEVSDLSEQIGALPHVVSVEYISKADAFQEFKKLYEDQPEFWRDLSRDALPASLRVKADAGFLQDVAESIPRRQIVEDVRYPDAQCLAAQLPQLHHTIERLRALLRRLQTP